MKASFKSSLIFTVTFATASLKCKIDSISLRVIQLNSERAPPRATSVPGRILFKKDFGP